MGVVLDFRDRSIRNIYLYIFVFTITVIVEAVLNGRSSTLPLFLCESTVGFFLFWSIEFADRKVSSIEKTKSKENLLTLLYLGRYIALGCLLYFLIKFLFIPTDFLLGLVAIVAICIGYFFSIPKRSTQPNMFEPNMFDSASIGFKVVCAFCIGNFVGRWIGSAYGNAEIGGNFGLAFGIVVVIIEGVRLRKKRSLTEQSLQENREDNLLRLNNDLPLF